MGKLKYIHPSPIRVTLSNGEELNLVKGETYDDGIAKDNDYIKSLIAQKFFERDEKKGKAPEQSAPPQL